MYSLGAIACIYKHYANTVGILPEIPTCCHHNTKQSRRLTRPLGTPDLKLFRAVG